MYRPDTVMIEHRGITIVMLMRVDTETKVDGNAMAEESEMTGGRVTIEMTGDRVILPTRATISIRGIVILIQTRTRATTQIITLARTAEETRITDLRRSRERRRNHLQDDQININGNDPLVVHR